MDPSTLENILEKKCENYFWLAWILFLTASPVILNSAHIASYVFLGGKPSFFCNIPELVEANWTKEQIRAISSPGMEKQSCTQYAWNYSLLKDMGFDNAVNHLNARDKPDVIKCKSFIYDEEVLHQTVVSEWDLVCDNLPISSTVQSAVAVGKLSGCAIFGIFSDRFGRKKIFVISCLLYAVFGTAAALVNSYVMLIILRILLGIAAAGVFDASFTILLELTVKNYRAYLGSAYNIGYSLGMIYLPLVAYFSQNWRQLQLALSVPLFLLIFHCWLMPESPRWLITNGKFDKAAKIIGKEIMVFKDTHNCPPNQPKSILENISIFKKKSLELFTSKELIKRILINFYLRFTGTLSYYSMALNGRSIDVDEYLYVGLNGIIEMPGYLLPVLFLKYFGRKTTGMFLWLVAAVMLLVTIVIPKGWPIICVTLFGRLVETGAYGVVMFYSSEMFPTEHRNFAIGICTTGAQLGPLVAPYLVDILGRKAWWMPTAACGIFALTGTLSLVLLPETRDKPIPDTIKEMNLS